MSSSVLKVRPETDDDCRLLWQWVNDADVRRWSFDSAPIDWESHTAWFNDRRSDPGCLMYILEDSGDRPVGLVRFDLVDGSGVVTISIDADHRGRGYGIEALRLACERFFEATDAGQAVAYIKPDNEASIRIFERAGFSRAGSAKVKGHDAVRMTRPRQVTADR